jgi:hypothetical protein
VTMAMDMNILASGWMTTAEAARAVGLSPQAFRVWLNRHKEVDKKIVGSSSVVRLESVFEARKRPEMKPVQAKDQMTLDMMEAYETIDLEGFYQKQREEAAETRARIERRYFDLLETTDMKQGEKIATFEKRISRRAVTEIWREDGHKGTPPGMW